MAKPSRPKAESLKILSLFLALLETGCSRTSSFRIIHYLGTLYSSISVALFSWWEDINQLIETGYGYPVGLACVDSQVSNEQYHYMVCSDPIFTYI